MGRDTELTVQWRLFAGIALFMAVITAIYWFTSYEEAGTVMLLLAAVLAGLAGSYLLWQERGRDREEAAEGEIAEYLPHASPWPFGIGLGAYLAVNGLILSWPFAVPGVVVLVVSLSGFIGQSRRRV